MSGTAVPVRSSATLVQPPLCTRVFDAELPGMPVPTRSSDKAGHTQLCTGAFPWRCQVRLCPLVPLQISLLGAVVYGSFFAEMSGTAVPARFSAFRSSRFEHTPLYTGTIVVETSSTVVPARFSSIACTRHCLLEWLMLGCLVRRCPFAPPLLWCNRHCVLECLMRSCLVCLCPLVPLIRPGTRSCVQERSRGGVRYDCARSFLCRFPC